MGVDTYMRTRTCMHMQTNTHTHAPPPSHLYTSHTVTNAVRARRTRRALAQVRALKRVADGGPPPHQIQKDFGDEKWTEAPRAAGTHHLRCCVLV